MINKNFLVLCLLLFTLGCSKDEDPEELVVQRAFAGEIELDLEGENPDTPTDRSLTIIFSDDINPASIENSILLIADGQVNPINIIKRSNSVLIDPQGVLETSTNYVLKITQELTGRNGEIFSGKEISFTTITGQLRLDSLTVSDQRVDVSTYIRDVPLNLDMKFHFNYPVTPSLFAESFEIVGYDLPLNVTIENDNMTAHIISESPLGDLSRYELSIDDQLVGEDGEPFQGFDLTFFTTEDPVPKFPEISDQELLTKIQEQTFKYFWDFGHPVSGLARERNTSGETVTSGGSGFGLMAIIVGIERGFITRQEGVDRFETIVNFLKNDADRFHGVWPHWMNGTTGNVVPFSAFDNGADLVETAFMIQGLLTVRQYLDPDNTQEATIIDNINTLWEEVEWDWFTKGGENVLYWHWSPNYEWRMDLPIRGWNEALIIYALAASSPTHPISPEVYHEGWARSGGIVNTQKNKYYGKELPLRADRGGPLFFSHYSFLGLDPRNLADDYANYWDQNVTHTQINRLYCISNPGNYVGYSSDCWGLTASDNHQGYSAHSPDNDLGVITPTAAISSIPYTPEYSMDAIRYFYYKIGDRLWGQYGFYDAFNLTREWTASSYLAIDQGPIIIMIENYRTGLLWDLFMSAPEIQTGLQKLNFTYEMSTK